MLKLLENLGQLLFIQGDNRYCAPYSYSMIFNGTNYVFRIYSLDSNLFVFEYNETQFIDENDNPFSSWGDIQNLLLKYMRSEALQYVQIKNGGIDVSPLTYSELTQSPIEVKSFDNFAQGSILALNGSVNLNAFGNTSITIDIRNVFVGTLTFQGTQDGVNYFPIFGVPCGSAPNTQAVSTTTTVGAWEFPLSNFFQFRVIMTAYTSGRADVRIRLLNNDGFTRVFNTGATTQPVSGTVIANQGTMVALPAGTSAIGDVGLQVRANATGAGSATVINCPATPVGQSIKATAGRILGFYVNNSSASLRWLKIFNTASPVLGTTSAVLDIPIPPSNNTQFVELPFGIGASFAIVIAVTGAKGLTNNSAITLDDVSGFISFA